MRSSDLGVWLSVSLGVWVGVWPLLLLTAGHVHSTDDQSHSHGYLPDEAICPQPGDHFLEQVQAPWGLAGRAWRTIPAGVKVTTSNIPEAGLGVFATQFIPAGSWLAEYEGVISTSDIITDTTYTWSVTRNNTEVHDIDAGHLSTSNWLRWVNCARTALEENVECVACYGRLYYRALTHIVPSTELLVYYGDEYAQELGVNTAEFSETETEREHLSHTESLGGGMSGSQQVKQWVDTDTSDRQDNVSKHGVDLGGSGCVGGDKAESREYGIEYGCVSTHTETTGGETESQIDYLTEQTGDS